jgi:predicted nucleotidyltransferase
MGDAIVKPAIDATVDQMVQAIVDAVEPEQVYLFGSRARGDQRADSDIDLMVVEREPFGAGRSRLQEIRRIQRLLRSFRAPIDVLVYSRDEFDRWRHSPNHVIGGCCREGRLLYAGR